MYSTKTAAQDQESKSRSFYFYVYFILAVWIASSSGGNQPIGD